MKLQKRSTQESFFSGIYFINEEYSKSGLAQLPDKQLGTRCKQVGFSYSYIIQNLMIFFLCGGDCAEDIQTHLNKDLKSIQNNFDYDNQIIPAEKYDTKKTHKILNGYCHGVATIGNKIAYIENRDGNTNVKFEQASTLTRAYNILEDNNI